MRPVKKFEAKLRVRLVLGTFPETVTRNHHLSLIFHQFLRLFCHTITKCAKRSYCVTSIVLGKNKHVKICLPMSAKLCALNHIPTQYIPTQLISLSFCSNNDQKSVFIVDFFHFLMTVPYCDLLVSLKDLTDLRILPHLFANTLVAGSEVN